MHITIVGYRRIEFTDQETGRLISGYRVYYLKDEYNVVGKAGEYCFISDRFGIIPEIGDELSLVYNREGRLVSVDRAAG